ncbi:hypothetical protein [Tsukamurella sp. PLM1]|uniref:hypothetical protein n=1 Tax=Tsukamurella sp. PLM1 TaxID=2929795 RepID=UPI00206C4278|nr:hypothetical protein [Tsukamurella sp. PLM1]BDH58883.1 hypothetical protein MTP03_38220 [Tsukamurella sp. PLM1]
MTDSTNDTTPNAREHRFSPALLVAGLAAIAVAVWGIVGGPDLISARTLVGVLAIGAVVVAGLVLIARPSRDDGAGPRPH